MKKTLNIALLSRDFLWGGGVELLRNLSNALLSIQDERHLKLFLLLPVQNKVDTFADLKGNIWRTAGLLRRQGRFSWPKPVPAYDPSVPDYFCNVDGKIETIEYNQATGLIATLRKIEADLVMPAAISLSKSFPFPWVGYTYDFQHKYFPNYFNADECLDRDILFATMLRDAKAVIVNAKSVKEDIDKFFPYHDCRVFNLPFSAAPVEAWLEASDPNLIARYNLPSRYFLISNQFWIHKSHSTAFHALALLKKSRQDIDLHIVCTGKMEDYRFPEHINNLQREIGELGIADQVHFLGHIPKADQIAIMKGSLAVIQPTFFEGGPGGGSVYDAVSLGVPALLSDIPVNREIENEKNLLYFETGSAADLADRIREFLQQRVDRPTTEQLIQIGGERKRSLGEKLLEVIDFVIGSKYDAQ